MTARPAPLLDYLRLFDSITDALLARKLRRPGNSARSLKSAQTLRRARMAGVRR